MNTKLKNEIDNSITKSSMYYSFQLQTTTQCNAACLFCPHKSTWGKKQSMYMSDYLLESILKQMEEFPIYRISPYLQNEPLCDPRIFDILKKIHSSLKFNHICFSTNAMALDKKKCDKLIDIMKKIPHQIRISFHGISKETYERNMKLDFDISKKNIIYFLKNAQEVGLNVEIRALGSKLGYVGINAYDFDKEMFVKFWKDICEKENIKMEKISFNYSSYHNRSNNVEAYSDRYIVRPDLTNFYCTRVDKCFHFLHNGKLVLCCNDYNQEIIMGDIIQSSLKDIIVSENYININKMVCGNLESKADFLCKRCNSPFKPWW